MLRLAISTLCAASDADPGAAAAAVALQVAGASVFWADEHTRALVRGALQGFGCQGSLVPSLPHPAPPVAQSVCKG